MLFFVNLTIYNLVWITNLGLCLHIPYSVNNSWRVANITLYVFGETVPIFLVNRILSTVRIWSNKIKPFFPAWVRGILNGAEKPLEVIGATMTVLRLSFN